MTAPTTTPTAEQAAYAREVTRLAAMGKRALIAEAHRQGKHRTVLFPPLPQWTCDDLRVLLAPKRPEVTA